MAKTIKGTVTYTTRRRDDYSVTLTAPLDREDYERVRGLGVLEVTIPEPEPEPETPPIPEGAEWRTPELQCYRVFGQYIQLWDDDLCRWQNSILFDLRGTFSSRDAAEVMLEHYATQQHWQRVAEEERSPTEA